MLGHSTRTAYIFAVESLLLSLGVNPIRAISGIRWARRKNGTGRQSGWWTSPGPAPSSRFTPSSKASAMVPREGGGRETIPQGQSTWATPPGNSDSVSNTRLVCTRLVFWSAGPHSQSFLLVGLGGPRIYIANLHPDDAGTAGPGSTLGGALV